MFLKMAKKANSEVFGVAKSVYETLDSINGDSTAITDYFEKKYFYVQNLKNAVMLMLGKAYDAIGKQYSTEQEILMNISDMLIQLYSVESTILRVEKLQGIKSELEYPIYKDICDVYVYEAISTFYKSAIDALNSFAEGEEYTKIMNGLRKLTTVECVNLKEARRRIANKLIEDNNYRFW
jgi:hypothetical protein